MTLSPAVVIAFLQNAAPTLAALAGLVATIRGRRHTKRDIGALALELQAELQSKNGENEYLRSENEQLREFIHMHILTRPGVTIPPAMMEEEPL